MESRRNRHWLAVAAAVASTARAGTGPGDRGEKQRPWQASCKRERRGRYGPGSIVGQSPSRCSGLVSIFASNHLAANQFTYYRSISCLRRSPLPLTLTLTLNLTSISRKATVQSRRRNQVQQPTARRFRQYASSLRQGQTRQKKTRQDERARILAHTEGPLFGALSKSSHGTNAADSEA